MESGIKAYRQLKAYLDIQGITMTSFAAAHGSSPQSVRGIVLKHYGTGRLPKNQHSKEIIAAVKDILKHDDEHALAASTSE